MVTDFIKQCGYSIGGLRDFIYLIPYTHDRFSYDVDGDEAKALKLNDASGIIRVEGYKAQFKNTETNDDRLRFESQLNIYSNLAMNPLNYTKIKQLIQNRYFVVFEDLKGNQFVQSVEYYSQFKYSMNVTDNANANYIQLQFLGSTNFPTLMLETKIERDSTTKLFGIECQFNKGGVSDFRMGIVNDVLIKDTNNDHIIQKVITLNDGLKNIQFIEKSFTYQQIYSEGNFEDTLTFSIPLSEYKSYWAYKLAEFAQNRYVSIFSTSDGTIYCSGYDKGATVSYTVETNTNASQANKMTITLKYVSNEGFYMRDNDQDMYEYSLGSVWSTVDRYVGGIPTTECIGFGKAKILLLQRKTKGGLRLNEYSVLEGYESRFTSLNVTSTFTLQDTFGFPLIILDNSCEGDDCLVETDMELMYYFSDKFETNSFLFKTDCGIEITDKPSWLNITKNGDYIEMELTSTLRPTSEKSATFIIKVNDTKYRVNVHYSPNMMWGISDNEFTVSSAMQYLTIGYSNASKSDLDMESDTLELTNITDTSIIIKTQENITDMDKIHTAKIKNKKYNDFFNVKVTQLKPKEEWKQIEGFICENGNKYTKLQLWVNGDETKTFKRGTLIETSSSDCLKPLTRWIQYDTVCDGVDEYQQLKKQISYDGGTTWTDTSEIMTGALVEENSMKCNPDRVEWRFTGATFCEDGQRCEVWERYIDEAPTGDTRLMNCVEDLSCAKIRMNKWEMTDQTQCVQNMDGTCDSYYIEEEYISYDNGSTWEASGLYRVSTTLNKKNDSSCNCFGIVELTI